MNDHQRKMARKGKRRRYAEGGEIEQTAEQRAFIEKMQGQKKAAPPPPPPPPPPPKKEGIVKDAFRKRLGSEY